MYVFDICYTVFKTKTLRYNKQGFSRFIGESVKEIHAFFISNTFISNGRLKLAKNEANAKQHTEAELLLFGNYSHSSSTLSFKNNRTYSEK